MVKAAQGQTQKAPTYWYKGQYLTAFQKGGNWYGLGENGEYVRLSDPLLHFAQKPENPLISQTQGFIEKREENIAKNENLVKTLKQTYKEIKNNLDKYLSSLGIKLEQAGELSDAKQSKIAEFQAGMSSAHRSINRAEMDIRGDLLSNFMDYCSLMKMV